MPLEDGGVTVGRTDDDQIERHGFPPPLFFRAKNLEAEMKDFLIIL